MTEVSPVALNLVSDGSVHLAQRVVSCTWVVHQQDGSQLQVWVHLEPMTSIPSYRSKLEGMYRGLCTLRHLGITAAILRQWCDSTAAVDGCNKRFLGPTALVAPDADVLLAIRFLLRQLGRTKVICRHIRRHQDTKGSTSASPLIDEVTGQIEEPVDAKEMG